VAQGSTVRFAHCRRTYSDGIAAPETLDTSIRSVNLYIIEAEKDLDLHLLLNTLATSATLRTSESWVPMCFPKFNPAGFVHAYVSYVMEDIGLVFVSADRDAFEGLREWKATVLEASVSSHGDIAC
jgi:hypothetical protein